MKPEDESMEIKILKAAEKLFVEQGLAKTTTGQIAKEAGCNQALVHYYYRTKDNLFEKVFEEKICLMATNLLGANSTGGTFEEKITRMIEIHFDFLMENAKLVPFVFNEFSSNPDRVRLLFDRLKQYPNSIFTQIENSLREEVGKGTLRPVSGVDFLFTVVSLNVAPFLMKPIFQKVLNTSDEDYQEFLKHRKRETIDTVLARLRK